MILCQFQVYGEATHNVVFKVYKNGSIPIGSYPGYNPSNGNLIYSGIATNLYDPDNNSTPFQVLYYYHDFPNTTNAITYAPGITSSDGANNTYFINRSTGSVGGTSYENGVSFSIAWEIAQ